MSVEEQGARARPILPPQQDLGDVTDQLARIPLHFPTRRRWLIALGLSSLLLLLFVVSVTVLFSLIVTFANFDIVRILTNGGPQDHTHVFATYAFQVGIQSGDIPLGASVSLFMFPILAVSAVFILRGVRKRAREIG